MILTCLKAVVEDLAKLAFRGEAFFLTLRKQTRACPIGLLGSSTLYFSWILYYVLGILLGLCFSWAVCFVLCWLCLISVCREPYVVFCFDWLISIVHDWHVLCSVDSAWPMFAVSCMLYLVLIVLDHVCVLGCMLCHVLTVLDAHILSSCKLYLCLSSVAWCVCVCVLCITLCLLTLCHSMHSLPPVGLEWKCTNNFYHIMTFLWVCDCTLFSFPHRLHNS